MSKVWNRIDEKLPSNNSYVVVIFKSESVIDSSDYGTQISLAMFSDNMWVVADVDDSGELVLDSAVYSDNISKISILYWADLGTSLPVEITEGFRGEV